MNDIVSHTTLVSASLFLLDPEINSGWQRCREIKILYTLYVIPEISSRGIQR